MIQQLTPGTRVHAKRIFIMDDNGNKYEFSAGRGEAFTMILMGVEKPDPDSGIVADDFLKKCGWIPDPNALEA